MRGGNPPKEKVKTKARAVVAAKTAAAALANFLFLSSDIFDVVLTDWLISDLFECFPWKQCSCFGGKFKFKDNA